MTSPRAQGNKEHAPTVNENASFKDLKIFYCLLKKERKNLTLKTEGDISTFLISEYKIQLKKINKLGCVFID